MDDKIEFKNALELYNRVLPALYSKTKELKKIGFSYINEKDIWNYLVDNKWKKHKDLELFEMISDIIHLDNFIIKDYVMNKLNNLKKDNDEEIKNIDESILKED